MSLIKLLADDKCILEYDPKKDTLENLQMVIRKAFPSVHEPLGRYRYYYCNRYSPEGYDFSDNLRSNQNPVIALQQFVDELEKVYTLKDVSEGNCAVTHTGKPEDLPGLTRVLQACFPNDTSLPSGTAKYYFRWYSGAWDGTGGSVNIPSQDLSVFLEQLTKEIIGYKLSGDVSEQVIDLVLGRGGHNLRDLYLSKKDVNYSYEQGKLFNLGVLDKWLVPVYDESKTVTFNHSKGTSEVVLKDGLIYFPEDDANLNVQDLRTAIKPIEIRVAGGKGYYKFEITHVNIGCLKNISVNCIENVLKEYDKLNKK